MRRYWSYFKYVVRHRWFVFVACCREGLLFRGLIHDWSKFRPGEFFPYAKYFYHKDGSKVQRRDKTGYYKPYNTGDLKFDYAWLLHQKRNKHHWQWWVLPQDDGGQKILDMPYRYIIEMLCDWRGAAKAQGVENPYDVRPWYHKNKAKMILSERTRNLIESIVWYREKDYLE